jgi:hypothetical protein
LDLSYQGTQGWQLPTLAELAAGPTQNDFFFSGANVPNGGTSVEGTFFDGNTPSSDGACATAYFTDAFYNQCDFDDAAAGAIYGLDNDFTGNPNVETWLVRGTTPAPEPLTVSLFCAGLAGAVAMRRRKKKDA